MSRFRQIRNPGFNATMLSLRRSKHGPEQFSYLTGPWTPARVTKVIEQQRGVPILPLAGVAHLAQAQLELPAAGRAGQHQIQERTAPTAPKSKASAIR